MHIHEYQAKDILKRYGIPSSPFGIASSEEDVKKIINEMRLQEAVLKAQVHAGGRGKVGGIKFAKNKEEILRAAKSLIGMRLINEQTGEDGLVAHLVLITAPILVDKEYYLGAMIDRNKKVSTLICSKEGGVDIEELSKDKILRLPMEEEGKLRVFQLLRIAKFMGWSGKVVRPGLEIVKALCKAFCETDASLIEINPLALTKEGEFSALDAKMSIDDNALFRQKELAGFYDPTQLSTFEVLAKQYDLSYVPMHGNIGCMVNGAGLAMATMDILKYFGGNPANFLDVGGSASKEKIAEGFKILLSDSKVKAILINIFGGIMNCVTVAEGILSAFTDPKFAKVKTPIVVRMEGTNVEKGRYLLLQSKIKFIFGDNLKQAAKEAVIAAGLI